MPKFQMQETVDIKAFTAKLGATPADQLPNALYADTEIGKLVKLVAGSRYVMAATGDQIEGMIIATEPASVDGFCLGTITSEARRKVTLDGSQATPGAGVVALGDYVVTGTVIPKGTRLTEPARVCKRTDPTTVAGVLAATFRWRVVEIYGSGIGIPGAQALIERVNS